MRSFRLRILLAAAVAGLGARLQAAEARGITGSGEWRALAPRDEIRPSFSIAGGGAGETAAGLVIEADTREGLHGWWQRSLPVEGGKHYRFSVRRQATGLAAPRRSAVVRVQWRDDAGKSVLTDELLVSGVLPGYRPTAEPEYPGEVIERADGWVEVAGTYRAPPAAKRAVIELHLQWAANARVEWRDVALVATDPPPARLVRLAAVHYRPKGGQSPMDNCREFAPLIADAARQRADLVVLPETLTYYGLRRGFADCAEPVPGPSTEFFGALAKQHGLYIVAGLVERDGALLYNVAALLSPDGRLAGKYRKVALPRGEIEGGLQPGSEYPVFETRFGKLGLMVCYDGFFPEVARQLTLRGAEVIAWPVWGCNPLLASARAVENHVFLVSSTYEDVSRNWMLTAVYDRSGQVLTRAEKWGEVVVTEVDLNRRTLWPSLGDFRAEIAPHRPTWENEPAAGHSHHSAR